MDKLKMHSLNKVDANIAAIGKLFPNCVTKRMGTGGKVEAATNYAQIFATYSPETDRKVL